MSTEENKPRQLSSPVLGLVLAAVWLALSGTAVAYVAVSEAEPSTEGSYEDGMWTVPSTVDTGRTTARRTSTRTTTRTTTTTTTTTATTTSGTTRQVSSGGMSTEVPADWTDQASASSCVRQVGDALGRFLRYGSCPVGAQGLQGYVADLEQGVRGRLQGYRRAALSDTTFRNAPAMQWEFAFVADNGTPRTTTARFWLTGSSVHWIYLSAPDPVAAESRPLFEAMLAAARP